MSTETAQLKQPQKIDLRKGLILALLLLILGRFWVVGMPKILFNHISSDGDESAYLELGLALKEEGVLSDGTRPPLYALLLSPFAERDWSYFTTAKLVTLGIGMLTLLALFWVGVRMFSWETALLAVFLLGANKEFHVRATTVYADILLALVMIGAWYFLIKSVTGWKSSAWAGFFVGLSFLTKGSAPVLLAAWGLMVLLHYRWTIFRHLELLWVPICFVITSLPLLIYNANTFGSPTYNFATQHIMWMDQLAQINTADPADLPTFSSYMATHTPDDMISRVQKGMRRLHPVISRTVIPSRTFEPSWIGPFLALLAVGGLIFLLIFQRQSLLTYLRKHQNKLLFTFFLYGLFYIFFTWYVAGSSAETRFVVPLLGPLYLLLADMIVSASRGLETKIPPLVRKSYRGAIILLAIWWLIQSSYAARWGLTVDPYESDRQANVEPEAVVQWLNRDRGSEETFVAFGPSKSLPLWKFPARFTVERLPMEIDHWADMESYLQTRQPDYLILDDDTVRRRREALAGHFQRKKELIYFDQIPTGWVLDFAYPKLPCRWCIFSPMDQADQILAQWEGGFELLSYHLVSAPDIFIHHPSSEGDEMRVRLTWRTRKVLTQDYTLFVHLTAPDGFVKAQHDQQPFEGAFPTSRWQPGELLADRFDLVFDQPLPAGDYLLLAGMYDPSTGERLPLTTGEEGPVPNTVLLDRIKISP